MAKRLKLILTLFTFLGDTVLALLLDLKPLRRVQHGLLSKQQRLEKGAAALGQH